MEVFKDTLRFAGRPLTRASRRLGRSVVQLSMGWSAVCRVWSAVSEAA